MCLRDDDDDDHVEWQEVICWCGCARITISSSSSSSPLLLFHADSIRSMKWNDTKSDWERLSEHKWCALLFWRFNASRTKWNGCAKASVYPFVMCHSIRSVTYVQLIEQIQSNERTNEQTIDLSAGSITTDTHTKICEQAAASEKYGLISIDWFEKSISFHLLFHEWKSAADNGSRSQLIDNQKRQQHS